MKLDAAGEKFTPVVVNGTTTPGEVSVSVMTDSEVYKTFSNHKLDWVVWELRNIFPDGVSSRRAWIKIIPGQSKTTLRAQVDLSARPAAGIYSDRSMSALAKEYGVNYFTGIFPVFRFQISSRKSIKPPILWRFYGIINAMKPIIIVTYDFTRVANGGVVWQDAPCRSVVTDKS